MNKVMLVFAPILTAGILFGVSGSNFMKSGIPDSLPETERLALNEKGKELLMNEIITPIQNKKKYNKAEMYSRCPSGITHYVTAMPTTENPYFAGKVYDRSGCNSQLVCLFRIDKKEEVLEAKSTEEAQYLSVSAWKQNMRNTQWNF